VPSAQYPPPAPQTSPNPCPFVISLNSTSGLGGNCITKPTFGLKAAVPSIPSEPSATSYTVPHTMSNPRTPNQAQPPPLHLFVQFQPVVLEVWLIPSLSIKGGRDGDVDLTNPEGPNMYNGSLAPPPMNALAIAVGYDVCIGYCITSIWKYWRGGMSVAVA